MTSWGIWSELIKVDVSVLDYFTSRAFKLQSQKNKETEAYEFSPFFWGVFHDRYRVKNSVLLFVVTYLALFVYSVTINYILSLLPGI